MHIDRSGTLPTSKPRGQTFTGDVAISGIGCAQGEGEAIFQVRAGDVIWCPPGQRRWEGGTPDQAMTHVAIHEAKDGRPVEFGEQVADDDYLKGPSRT